MIHYGKEINIDNLKVYEGYLLDSDILDYGSSWEKVVERVADLIERTPEFQSFIETCAHIALNQLAKEQLISYDLEHNEFSIIEDSDET